MNLPFGCHYNKLHLTDDLMCESNSIGYKTTENRYKGISDIIKFFSGGVLDSVDSVLEFTMVTAKGTIVSVTEDGKMRNN